jgi:serine protease Do
MKQPNYFRRYYFLLLIGVLGLLQATSLQAATLPDFTDIVKDNSQVVVNISTQKTEGGAGSSSPQYSVPGLPKNDPFNEFFKRFFQNPGGQPQEQVQPQKQVLRSLGSGFIISSDGYIITNAHVVDGADKIIVHLANHSEKPAKLIGSDKLSDVALIKIDATGLPVANIGDSSHLQVGQWVLAIGDPFGFDHTATQGIISALHRNLPNESYVPFIQTDVPVNPGNSGGPLFNTSGKVIGINSEIYSNTGGYMGLSFAIPIELAMNVANQLKTTGSVKRGWLGVLIQPVNQELSQAFKLKHPVGALVAQVTPGSPAAKAGIKAGDIITKYNGHEVSNSDQLPALVASTKVGNKVSISVIRKGETKTLTATIAELNPAKLASAEDQLTVDKLDITVANLSSEQRNNAGVGDLGVIVDSVKNGPAANAGIRPGDIILNVDNREVHNINDMAAINEHLHSGELVPVLVERNKQPLYLALKITG